MYALTEEEEEEQEHLTGNCDTSSFPSFQAHHQPWFLPTTLPLPQQTDESFTCAAPELHQEAACLPSSPLRAHTSPFPDSESLSGVSASQV